MEKRWYIKKQGDAESVKRLAEKLNINNHLANLLIQRGINDFEGAKYFFRPQLSDIHDPFLMKDMDKAVQRIKKAIKNNEKILVYGDYDVDGTTAVAMVYLYLTNIYSNVDF
ncbi:MAG: single-stranded-DNA-specific exonuclease RecJ, partial [Bacteroidales bacterium]|nr:single-stranded-DNA-specific exonuclease RecJ [Bacteroidales bacterium]